MRAGADVSMTARIAVLIASWAAGRPRWTPLPANRELGAGLDFTASDATFLAAKRRLAARGVLVLHGRRYYVA